MYFLCNTSRRLLLNLQTILIVPAPSFLLYLYVGTKMGGGLNALPQNIKAENSYVKFKEYIATWFGPKRKCNVCSFNNS